MADKQVQVELVYATSERQELLNLTVAAGTTIAQLIDDSGIAGEFPDQGLESAQAGVWGRLVDHEYQVVDGDRIEIYRSLQIDPRDARRLLAESGRTMNQGREE